MKESSGSSALRTYVLTRLALALPTILILLTVVFLLMRVAPGDPITASLGARLPAKELEETLAQMVDGSVVLETADDAYALTEATREVLASRPKAKPASVRKPKRGKGRSAASSR